MGVWPSHLQAASINALGAQATEGGGIDGLAGVETMWSAYLNNGWDQPMPFVTANAVLWPRTTASSPTRAHSTGWTARTVTS